MKITKIEKKILNLVLMIFIIAVYLPGEILAVEVNLLPVVVFSDDVTYNGKPQVLAELNPSSGQADINPGKIQITYSGLMENGNPYLESTEPPTEAGSYLVTIKYEGDDNYRSYSETKEIMIKPIELKLTDFTTKEPITKDYDGSTNVPEKVIDGLSNTGVLEKDLNEVKFSYESSEFISKDVKSIELNKIILNDVKISGDKATCYHLTPNPNLPNNNPILGIPNKDSVTVELSGKITPKLVRMVLIGEDKVYDADAGLDSYELSLNEEDVIEGEKIGVRTTDAFNPWYGEMTNQVKDVGQYYVWASEGFYLYGLNDTIIDNYTVGDYPISSKEKYAITPISIVVEARLQSKVEGSRDPELTYDIWRDYESDKENQQYNEGLLNEDVFSGALSRTPGEGVGKYDICIGTLNNPNYSISFENGKDMFEILPAAQIRFISGSSTSAGASTLSDSQEDPNASNPLFPKLFFTGMAIIGGAFFMKMRNV